MDKYILHSRKNIKTFLQEISKGRLHKIYSSMKINEDRPLTEKIYNSWQIWSSSVALWVMYVPGFYCE